MEKCKGGKVEKRKGVKVERCKGERQARHGVRHVWPARRSQTPRAEAARSARSANPAQDIEMVTLFGERTRRSRVPTRGKRADPARLLFLLNDLVVGDGTEEVVTVGRLETEELDLMDEAFADGFG